VAFGDIKFKNFAQNCQNFWIQISRYFLNRKLYPKIKRFRVRIPPYQGVRFLGLSLRIQVLSSKLSMRCHCVYLRKNYASKKLSENFWPKLIDSGGRCYDHYFQRLLRIFGKKWRFSKKNNVIIQIFQKLAGFCTKNANFFAKCFGENILKIKTSVPDHHSELRG
jgi:hypothetical protein